MDPGRAALLRRAVFAVLIFAAGMAAGYALKSTGEPDDKQIRPGRRGLTNPLFDCEVGTYPRGRELSPFKTELAELIVNIIARGEASEVALYFRDLDNGPWFGIDERTLFKPASLLKVPLLMACLLQAESDPAFLRREIRYQGLPDKEGIGEFVAEAPLVAGRTYTVEQLIEQVAVYSDNYAALLLDELVDRKILDRLYRDLGLDPELVRDPLKQAAISPKTYGQLFRVLYNTSYLSREMSEKLLVALSRAVYRNGIVAGVPPGTTVAHKFGVSTVSSLGGELVQLHDCGIVYSPRRPYFLCVMTSGTDEQRLAGVIERTARFISDKVERQEPEPGSIALE